jgi:adenylate cyclase
MVFRLHTFLFADLVGFAEFTARHGDDRGADLAVSFYERTCSLAAELGCQVIKAIGDAVMVRSENAEAAVSLATRILALTESDGFPLARVGLDTGPAVERNGDWFGSTVNTASRVTSIAGAGELLMTERTRRAVAGTTRIELSARGRRRLKGLPEHVLFGKARELSTGPPMTPARLARPRMAKA